MKRQLYLLTLALIAATQARASELNLRFYVPGNFSVILDGFETRLNGSQLRIPSLRPGRHTLLITSYAAVRNPYRNPMPVVIYQGNVMVRDHSELYASVDRNGFHIDRIIPQQVRNNRGWDNSYDPRDRNRYNDPYNDPYDRRNDRRNDRDDDDYRNRGNYNNDYRNPNGYNRYMNTRDFDAFRQSVSNATFDNTRKSVAMAGIAGNSLSIEQIRDILTLFTFESTRLEVAKYAYDFTPDKNRYYELTDAFTFDSNKNEIAQMAGRK